MHRLDTLSYNYLEYLHNFLIHFIWMAKLSDRKKSEYRSGGLDVTYLKDKFKKNIAHCSIVSNTLKNQHPFRNTITIYTYFCINILSAQFTVIVPNSGHSHFSNILYMENRHIIYRYTLCHLILLKHTSYNKHIIC